MSFEQRFLNVLSIVARMCAGLDLAAQPGVGRRALKGLPLLMMALIWAAPQLRGQFTFPAQPLGNITCTYSAVPNQVRAESLADRTGDARLDCVNEGVFLPGAENDIRNYLSTDITLTLNTNVSGLLDGSKGADVPAGETGAVMTINDNNSYFPTSDSVLPAPDTCGIVGSSPLFKPDKRYPCPQKGVLAGPRSITWNSVQFPVPGAPNNPDVLPPANGDGIPICTDLFDQESSDSCFNVTTTVRITNIVANAAAIGYGGAILGTLTITGASIAVVPTNQQTLSNIFEGLTTDSEAEGGAFQCSEGIRVVNIELEEGVGGAFKTIGAPSFVQGDFAAENGYPVLELTNGFPPQPTGGTGGGATQATRFKISFRDVPDGVVLHVPNTVDEENSELEACVPAPGGAPLCLQRFEGAEVLVDASRDGGIWWFPQAQAGANDPAAPHQGKAFADFLRSMGMTVTELRSGTAISAATFVSKKLVIAVGECRPYTATELAAYNAYVSNGGRLILLEDHHNGGCTSNTLPLLLGLRFDGVLSGTITSFIPHPITMGTSSLAYVAGSFVSSYPPSAIILATLSAMPVMGVMTYGAGSVFFIGDANGIEQVPQPLTSNLLGYMLGQDGAGGGAGDYEVPLSNGNGHVIYEVRDGDPFRRQAIVVPSTFTCAPGSPTTNLQISATFFPLSDNGLAGGGPVPRFYFNSFEEPPTKADLGLEKTVQPNVVAPGVAQVVYTLTVTNYGLADATGVVVSDVLPPGLTYVSDDVGCVAIGSAVTCDLDDLAEHERAVINVTASVDANARGVLTNNAAVTSENSVPNPHPHSNFASASITVNRDPIADAGPDQTINAPGPGGVDVVLDGSGSSDPGGQPLSFTWTGPFGTTSGVSPVVHIPGGSHSVNLTVEDGLGGSDTDSVTINVRTLMVSPSEHTFVRPQGSDPASKPFFVKALGGTVEYSIARTASWLDSNITSGSSSGESDTIQAIADPGDLAPGSYTGSLVLNGPGVIKEALWAKLIVTANSVPGLPPPDPAKNGVMDAADFTPFGEPGHAMAPLSLVIIYGTDFVPEGEFSADGLPLPASLGGVMVLFDGIPGRLLFVSPTIIVVQLPAGVTPPVAEMIVTNGGEKAASVPQPVAIATHSPGIFTLSQDGLGQGIVTFAGGQNLAAPIGTVGDSRPATGGDYLTIWVNGLGPVDPPIEAGHNSCEPDGVCEPDGSNIVLHRTTTTPVIRVGNMIVPEGNVLFSGSSVASAAIYEVVFTMPDGTETGPDVPLTIDIGVVTSNTVTIAVE